MTAGMTATAGSLQDRRGLRSDLFTMLTLIVGTAGLAGRVGVSGGIPVLVCVGVAGILLPVSAPERSPALQAFWVLVLGTGAVAIAAAAAPAPPVPLWWWGVLGGVVSAVAEEAFFRRAMYGWLTRWGPGVAVWGSALAFALVHVRMYGPWILPLDVAIGVLFGWQRWASGRWTVPAVTHAAANVFLMIG